MGLDGGITNCNVLNCIEPFQVEQWEQILGLPRGVFFQLWVRAPLQ